MREQESQRGIYGVWRIISSMRVGLVLMFLLAGAATIGALLPIDAVAQGTFLERLIKLLGLDRVFTTWWFLGLAYLLVINTLACVVSRLGPVINVFRAPRVNITVLERLKCFEAFSSAERQEETTSRVVQTLLGSRYRVLQSPDEEQSQVYADKHRLALLGPLFIHIGLVVLVFGLAWVSAFGFVGTISKTAGSTFNLSNLVLSRGTIDTDYQVKIDKNTQQTFSVTGVREVGANLAILDKTTILKSGGVAPNSPFSFDDLRFYLVGFQNGVTVSTTIAGKTDQYLLIPTTNKTKFPFKISNTEELYVVFQVNPDFSPSRPAADYAIIQNSNTPVVLQQGHLNQGDTARFKDIKFSFDGFLGTLTLRVTNTAGLLPVMCGAVILAVGLFLSLFLRYRKVWIAIYPDGEQTHVQMGGFSPKQKQRFIYEFNDLSTEIKEWSGG